jgi:hypothetical protein
MSVGVLRWKIKESFFAYVGQLPDGVIEWSPEEPPGEFPLVEGVLDDPLGPGLLTFGGGVHLRGHGYLLDVDIRHPQIHLGEHPRLESFPADGSEPTTIVDLGDVQVSETAGAWIYCAAEPRLTFDATYLFGGTYDAGTVFDTLEIELSKPDRRDLLRHPSAVPAAVRICL